MAEANASEKSKTVYTPVQMSDGRTVQFAGKKKVLKETLIDESKMELAGDILQILPGAISIRMDFVNGSTMTIPIPLSQIARTCGHGAEQKFGDELASPADKPLSPEDMIQAIEDLNAIYQKGEWGKGRGEGGGAVAGANAVVQAVLEVMNTGRPDNGKRLLTIQDVKSFLQNKLDASKAADGENALTRRALYNSFRREGSPTAAVIKRLEAEKEAKKVPAVDVEAFLQDAPE